MFKIALLIALVCSVITLIGYAHFLMQRAKIRARVEAEVLKLAERVNSYQRRIDLVETHAVDYATSLSTEGTKALYQIRNCMVCAQNLLNVLTDLTESNCFAAFAQAEQLLAGDFPERRNTLAAIEIVDSSHLPRDREWEAEIEGLLQLIGSDVGLASQRRTNSGISSRRKRKGTFLSLAEAGIKVPPRESQD